MSVKCEEPIDELTVQVWLLCHHPNIKYCNLFASGTELRTDKQTDRKTDDPITRCPPPADLSGRGHKNRSPDLFMTGHCIAEISLNQPFRYILFESQIFLYCLIHVHAYIMYRCGSRNFHQGVQPSEKF